MKEDIKKMIDIMGNAALSNLCHIECDIDTNFDNECSLCRQATAIYKLGYRKQSDTVKEVAEKLKAALKIDIGINREALMTWNASNLRAEVYRGKIATNEGSIKIIDKLAEQYGKEEAK